MKYSIIVPVFNRPDEVDELLQSLTTQQFKDFEVIIVEDGSTTSCKDVCDKYAAILPLHYYYKENSGPGQSRNYGAERAKGEWLIILDSDVVLPEEYLTAVERSLTLNSSPTREGSDYEHKMEIAAFGGPDASHPSFTPVQKAISYSMTSFFTTGGIRGGKAGKKPEGTTASSSSETKGALDKFYPRSFNMGIRRDVYMQLGGFSKMRFGEDVDFSYRIVEAGYHTQLFPEAWVWHKRRTDFRKFFRQVYNSGIARINLEKRHPGTLKFVHLLPTIFTIGVLGCCLLCLLFAVLASLSIVNYLWAILFLSPLLLYSLLLCIDSSRQNKSVKVGILSIPAAFVQLMGYGFGFIESWWKRCVLKQDEFTAFEKNFYK
jgi:glycosyltransferase involved in cell wall biosynthesis